jgi:hypothetical protein
MVGDFTPFGPIEISSSSIAIFYGPKASLLSTEYEIHRRTATMFVGEGLVVFESEKVTNRKAL